MGTIMVIRIPMIPTTTSISTSVNPVLLFIIMRYSTPRKTLSSLSLVFNLLVGRSPLFEELLPTKKVANQAALELIAGTVPVPVLLRLARPRWRRKTHFGRDGP